ncbi:MAG: hypothetical protein ACE5JH_00815 [Acidobacteriota bacterium]
MGVHDDLFARALVLQAGGTGVAFVALDLIGFFYDDVVRIREEIRSRHPAVRLDHVLVASTHTHAGPDVLGLWTPPGRAIDSGYIASVRVGAAAAVAEAWRRRRPARISFASKRVPHLIRDTRLPHVIDDLALLMKVDREDGAGTIATLVNYADHPESLGARNQMISSDYPWATRLSLERRFGGVALFMPGAVGGLMTPLNIDLLDPASGAPVPKGSTRLAEAVGRALGRALIGAWLGRSGRGEGPVSLRRARIEVRRRELRVPLANPRFLRGLAEGRIWPRALSDDGTLRSEVSAVTLLAPATERAAGPAEVLPVAQFACVPGEIYPELVVGGVQDPQDPAADFPGAPREPPLRPMMRGRYRFVLGLCDDELGYIIPLSQWDEEPPFAYGRDRPQYGEINSIGPRAAPVLIDAFAGLLR